MPKDLDLTDFTDLSSLQSEPRGFSPDEMIKCEECLRSNPPTRLACLYCGSTLAVPGEVATKIKPALRPVEKGESGINLILIKANAELKGEVITQPAELLHLSATDMERLLNSTLPLPVARTGVPLEAELIERNLKALGLETVPVPDTALNIEARPTQRLRTVELLEDELVVFTTSGEGQRIPWSEISLIVHGRLFSTQVEVKQRRGRGSARQIVDSMQTTTDEEVLDIYTAAQDGGWRVLSNNFDFSCLGDEKGLIAIENFNAIKNLVCRRATAAEYNDSYNKVRRQLELIWPAEQQTSSGGWHRERAGKYTTSDVAVTSNESQFTRYSRLCHFLKKSQPANETT